MSDYTRVIPRDLFNEGNLLKCYGQLYIALEHIGIESCLEHDGDAFDVYQSQDDGATMIVNVTLRVRGDVVPLFRPLNSRLPYPLRAIVSDDDDSGIGVFTDTGELSAEFAEFLRA